MPGENDSTALGATLVADLTAFAVALGLPPDAGATDIFARIGSLKTDARDAKAESATVRTDLSKVLAMVDATNADAACGTIAGLKETAATAKLNADTVAQMKKSAEATEAKGLIDAAVAEGRIVPASNREKVEAIYARFGMEGLKANLETMTVHAALAGDSPTQVAPDKKPGTGKSGTSALSEDERVACKATGMTEAQYLEHRDKVDRSLIPGG